MLTHHVRLLKKEKIAHDTYSFTFEKPASFHFTAGQYLSLCVDPPEIAMPAGLMRELSIASAPHEETLVLAFRLRNTPAKKQFLALTPDDYAYIQGPFGTFQLDETENPAVFLAGGIGIVPFLSMLKQTYHEKKKRQFYVFFSNRRQGDIPFLPELKELARAMSEQLTLVTVLTAETAASQMHESGYISPLLLKKYLNPLKDLSFYVSGPQRFVGGMWEVLEEMGVNEANIHGEEFTGY